VQRADQRQAEVVADAVFELEHRGLFRAAHRIDQPGGARFELAEPVLDVGRVDLLIQPGIGPRRPRHGQRRRRPNPHRPHAAHS